jgi:hypothetical protein
VPTPYERGAARVGYANGFKDKTVRSASALTAAAMARLLGDGQRRPRGAASRPHGRVPERALERCQFHLQQNADLYVTAVAMRAPVVADLRAILTAPDQEEAEHPPGKFLDRYAKKAPKLPRGPRRRCRKASWRSPKTGRLPRALPGVRRVNEASKDFANYRRSVAQSLVPQAYSARFNAAYIPGDQQAPRPFHS